MQTGTITAGIVVQFDCIDEYPYGRKPELSITS
jgi:hypothetical protein